MVNILHLKLFLFSLYKSVLWEEKKAKKYSECTGKKEIFPSMVRKHFCLISQRKSLSLFLSHFCKYATKITLCHLDVK